MDGLEIHVTGFFASYLPNARGASPNTAASYRDAIAQFLGFCAERAAAAEMLKDGECLVRRIVTINRDSRILPPCGSCREFLMQLGECNADAIVAVDAGRDLPLAQLLPERWN